MNNHLKSTEKTFGPYKLIGLRENGKLIYLDKEEYAGTRIIPHLTEKTKSVRELRK